MQIVIDIPEERYYMYKNDTAHSFAERAILQGIVLPRNHGRLGDIDFLARRIKNKNPIGPAAAIMRDECYQEILYAKTIIEAKG